MSILVLIIDGGSSAGLFDVKNVEELVDSFYSSGNSTGNSGSDQSNSPPASVRAPKRGRAARRGAEKAAKKNAEVILDIKDALKNSVTLKHQGLSLEHITDVGQITTLVAGVVLGKVLADSEAPREAMIRFQHMGRVVSLLYRTLDRMEELRKQKELTSKEEAVYQLAKDKQTSLMGVVMYVLESASHNVQVKEKIVKETKVISRGLLHLPIR